MDERVVRGHAASARNIVNKVHFSRISQRN
ncbi:hypothetical protein MTBUT4_20021 [Magnetospirillum sp. UT-4]|nr:hypothetical protein MTBUT4_20021 [Magnetospirillum sp. UT-4]